MRNIILLIIILLSLGMGSRCSSQLIKNSSGSIDTWDNKEYNFKHATIIINDENIIIVNKQIIEKKNLKNLSIVSEDY